VKYEDDPALLARCRPGAGHFDLLPDDKSWYAAKDREEWASLPDHIRLAPAGPWEDHYQNCRLQCIGPGSESDGEHAEDTLRSERGAGSHVEDNLSRGQGPQEDLDTLGESGSQEDLDAFGEEGVEANDDPAGFWNNCVPKGFHNAPGRCDVHYRLGVQVILHDLQAMWELNGCRVEADSYEAVSDRYFAYMVIGRLLSLAGLSSYSWKHSASQDT
jgi:hypothetical protein